MERVGFKMKLFPGQQAEYKKRHDEIWPELAEMLAARGIRDFNIFHDPETDILFAFMRRTPGARLDDLDSDPVMRKWWDYMADVMETEPGNKPVQVPLVDVFHMD